MDIPGKTVRWIFPKIEFFKLRRGWHYQSNFWYESTLFIYQNNDSILNTYKKLIDIDKKLGTTNSEQLYECINVTTRLDLIRVCKIQRKYIIFPYRKYFKTLDLDSIQDPIGFEEARNNGFAGLGENYLFCSKNEPAQNTKENEKSPYTWFLRTFSVI